MMLYLLFLGISIWMRINLEIQGNPKQNTSSGVCVCVYVKIGKIILIFIENANNLVNMNGKKQGWMIAISNIINYYLEVNL